MPLEIRPLAAPDLPRVQPLAARAFDDVAVRQGRPPRDTTPAAAQHYRRQHEHLAATGRGLGAYAGDDLVGVALSYERERTWVLALLVVEPERQDRGAGSALLRASLEDAAALRLLHSSRDPRAMRLYSRAGFRLLPAITATGRVRPPDGVARALDADLAAELDGCRHLLPDLQHVRATGGRVLALADGRRGLAVVTGPEGYPRVAVLGAADELAGQELLRSALAQAAGWPGEVQVGPLAPQEHWAVPVVLEAGLELSPAGPVAVAGLADPLGGLSPPPAVLI